MSAMCRLLLRPDFVQLIELRMDTVSDAAAVARERGWVVDERRGDVGAEIRQIVQLPEEALDERRTHLGQQQPHMGDPPRSTP